MSTSLLPEGVPGIDVDLVSFFFGGGEVEGLKFDSLPYKLDARPGVHPTPCFQTWRRS